MKKTLDQLASELDAPIPRSAVKEREGAGRRSFSYLSADYVIDRLNKVVGQLNWASETVENKAVFEGQVNGKHCVSYIARVRIEVQHVDENARVIRTSHTGTGYGDGSDANNLGKAHELAAKEAESDALKRAAKNLGMSMGLALYDKDQTNVEDDAPAAKSVAAAPAPRPAASEARKPATNVHADRPKVDREFLNKKISSLSKILLSKGKATQAELVAELGKYGVGKKEDLTDEQAQQLVKAMESQAVA